MTLTTPSKRKLWADRLCEISMLLYIVWLTLPTLQTLGRSYFGAFTVLLFVAGVLMDTQQLKKDWLSLTLRAAAVVALPIILYYLLKRGGEGTLLPYFVQNGMFWFPLVWSAVMIGRGKLDHLLPLLRVYMVCVLITTVTTLVGNFAKPAEELTTYSRLLALGDTSAEKARGIMLRGIGSYDFVYAVVMMLPMLCWFIMAAKGYKRWLAAGFIVLMLVMCVKCMFLYAVLFSGAILVVELLSAFIRWIVRKAMKKELSVGWSMLATLPVFLIVYLLRFPILNLGISIADSLNLSVISLNLNSVLQMFEGTIDPATNNSRLWYYLDALDSFSASPLLGGITSSVTLSQHSETMDLLAGVGLIGTAVCAALCWLLGRGNLKNVRKAPCFPHVMLTLVALLGFATVGTVTYSRDISLYLCLMFCYLAAGCPMGKKTA